jgi:UDP-glucose 4-epimerase
MWHNFRMELREILTIWGDDYNTHEHTSMREDIHVVCPRWASLRPCTGTCKTQDACAINLGIGIGHFFLDVVLAPLIMLVRNLMVSRLVDGISSNCYANPSLSFLGWGSERSLKPMCLDLWCWDSQNSQSYSGA